MQGLKHDEDIWSARNGVARLNDWLTMTDGTDDEPKPISDRSRQLVASSGRSLTDIAINCGLRLHFSE